ncbi:acyltransferase [Pseudarthrobacter sp. J64]|uniref:acyltransferase family protein n=1 Tax=Pseudarthrobacter sp. J64 TaxID=3116485 RepID=UPI002E8194F8|nr:acyltransferase [Pseudarthrobacter sp. J64]MEE2569994.1 acyltransferase [Pseudarthrobacter sp. J64]
MTTVQGESQRDPAIDLLRFFCLALVVMGHCLMVSPQLHPDGTVTTQNTLGDQPWFTPVIWIFMVMPVFFVTGGSTGLQSWRRLKAGGGRASQYAHVRMLRLIRPTAALLACMFAGLWIALLAGVHPQVIQLLAAGAGMPLWFLAAYLTTQLSLPLLAGLHDRAPWLTLAGLVSLVIAVDSLRGSFPLLAHLNMVFLWCAVQQLGFLLADSTFARLGTSGCIALILGANLVLGVVTGVGIYSGNMLVNLNPPNLCLFLLAVAQTAAFQLARPGLEWLSSVKWINRLVRLVGARCMTVYLWHLPLVGALLGLLLLTDLPLPAAGSAEWWWSRPLVLAAVVLLLLPTAGLFGWLEERPTAPSHSRGRAPAAVVTAGVLVFLPVVDAALQGLSLGLLGGGAACFALAVLLLGRVPERMAARPLPPAPSSASLKG